jgi:ElaB/YqjD/DUF883 family membrane-anchored ribosome-binding protein
VLEPYSLTNSDKLDEDFKKFNMDIEQVTEKELNRIRDEINALKEKANKTSEELLRPFSNEKKGR